MPSMGIGRPCIHQGGARYDDTWDQIGPLMAGETFLGVEDLTWQDALSQSDQGSPWNTLARAYAAAYLNTLAGSDPADLNSDTAPNGGVLGEELGWTGNILDEAESLLTGDFEPVNNTLQDDYSPNGDTWTRKELRALGVGGKQISQYLNSFAPFLVLAEYLDAYNNGDSYGLPGDAWYDDEVGPGHADD